MICCSMARYCGIPLSSRTDLDTLELRLKGYETDPFDEEWFDEKHEYWAYEDITDNYDTIITQTGESTGTLETTIRTTVYE